MTPAINLAKQQAIVHWVHQYKHDPATDSYGLEAAEKLDVDAEKVFKTLVVQLETKELVVAVIPVCHKLSMKSLAKSCNAKKAVMAPQQAVERATGYILGGVSPLGQKKRLRTLIDESANAFNTIYVSAGKRGLEIELAATDLRRLINGKFAVLTCS
ncbi:Cys-tRNA(Pro) deacylase [Corallincola holothuriorum]|uniref:Cys-tRNA(Pro)/Cys-tRNA(Cys) deacylase n=1 Tax=Corallincola holothuriorum TaxID=2282215 RepID=A0A368NML3_9GAMM|nr:Cys-tRNA(Pro) deacylase [Corallincola holothuriorum]RCU50551.1 Cys-tRNA(Pro) deacylase [Corallincola holothuriorum]